MATFTLFTEFDGDLIFDANLQQLSQLQFHIFAFSDTDVTGLTVSDFNITGTVNTGSITTQIQNLTGDKRLFVLTCAITNLPPSSDANRNGTITVTLQANAVTQGNTAVSLTVNYNYYRQDLTYPYDNRPPDDFSLLATSVGRYKSLSIFRGLIYGLKGSKLEAIKPETGARDTTKDITIRSSCSSAVIFNSAVYGLRDDHLEKYIKNTSDTDFTTVANSVEYKESGYDEKDFLCVGKKGFYYANEIRTGTPGTPGTPGVPAFNETIVGGGYSKSFSTPISVTFSATHHDPSGRSAYVSINGSNNYIRFEVGDSQTLSGVTSIYVSFCNLYLNISSSGTPGTPGTPSTQTYTLKKNQLIFEIMAHFQELNSANKQIYENTYALNLTNLRPIYDYGSYDYEDIFIVGYDNEVHYGKIGAYLAAFDDDLTVIEDTFVKTVSESNAYPPAYAFDADYIYRASNNNLYRYEKSKLHKPIVKSQIYPILVTENSTIDVRKYVKNFTRLTFEEGYSPPAYAGISGHTLTIGTITGAEVFFTVKLRAFNRRGATEKDAITLPIVVLKTPTTPTWAADFSEVTIDAGGSFDLTEVLSDADSVSGVTLPSGASVSGFILTIGSVGGSVTLRATKGNNTVDKTFRVDLPKSKTVTEGIKNPLYKILIGGVDVSADLDKTGSPVLTKTLDSVFVGVYKQDTTQFSLKYRNGYYTSDLTPNFWSVNGVAADGYNAPVKIYLVWRDATNTEREVLAFAGVLSDTSENLKANLMTFTVTDDTHVTQQKALSVDFGTLAKYVSTYEGEESYEGAYNVESSMAGILKGSAKAWGSDGTALTLKEIQNSAEGVVVNNSAKVYESDIRTQGGFVDAAPLLRYQLPYRRKLVRALVNAIANASGFYNAKFQIADKQIASPFIQSRGNFQYKTLPHRITHIVRDWVRDATTGYLHILLSQADKRYADRLIRYDPDRDTEVTLKVFDQDLTLLKMLYHSSDFYFIATRGIETDFSGGEGQAERDTLEVVTAYDGNVGKSCQLIKYSPSSGAVTTVVDTSAAYPPQGGMHYQAGFENENVQVFNWEGIVPDSRGNFKVYSDRLYYRWAKGNQFGVARSNLTGSTVTALWTVATGDHLEELKFDFDISSTGVVFIAYVEQTSTGSKLLVKKHQSGSSVDVLTDTKTFVQLTDTAPEVIDAGGWYAGVHEARLDGDDLYLSVEIGRVEVYYASGVKKFTRSVSRGAGAAIYKIDTASGSPSLQLIQAYNFSQEGGRSLTPHDSKVFFVESPAEVYKFPIVNPDFQNESNISNKGALKSIGSTGDVSNHGNLWYEGQAFRGLNTRLISDGDVLNAVMQYGAADAILQRDSEASRVDNFQWIQRGRTLNFIVDRLPETDNPYNQLTDLAKKVHGYFQLTDNRVVVSERGVDSVALNGALTASATTVTYDSPTDEVPASGHLLVDNEILSFTGKTAMTLTGVTRGVNGTTAAAHLDNAQGIFIDTLVAPVYLTKNKQKDRDNLYNIIESSDTLDFVKDDASIAAYQEENEYSLALGLGIHDIPWIQYLLGKYLEELKDLHQVITVSVAPNWDVAVGDIVTFQEGDSVLPMRVVSLTQEKTGTRILGRTV